jgi:hypothetical protein
MEFSPGLAMEFSPYCSADATTNTDPSAEISVRRNYASALYLDNLARQNVTLPSGHILTEKRAQNPSPLNETSFDPFTYHIKPPTFTAFLGFLKSKKLKYTHYVSRRHCTKCNQGQLAAKMIELEDTNLAQIAAKGGKGTQAFKEAKKNRDTYQDHLTEYTSHLEHMDTARVHAYKCRDNMKVGEVFVTRDYVNHYDHSGAHVKCLHWVMQWREVEGGSLELLKVRHYCSDRSMKTNHGFTTACMHFMFHTKDENHPGLFDRFHTVYFAGDHGGHFAHAGTSPPLLRRPLRFGFHYFLNVCVNDNTVKPG